MTKLEKLRQETVLSLFVVIVTVLEDSYARKFLCSPTKEIIHSS